MTNVEKFFEKLKTDKELQRKVRDAETKYAGDKKYREAVVKALLLPIAAEAGFPFAVDELAEYEKSLATNTDGTEISTDELRNVSGGSTICAIIGGGDTACVLLGTSDDTGCVLIGTNT